MLKKDIWMFSNSILCIKPLDSQVAHQCRLMPGYLLLSLANGMVVKGELHLTESLLTTKFIGNTAVGYTPCIISGDRTSLLFGGLDYTSIEGPPAKKFSICRAS
uniref:Uncharacterized protein n=1 Tax=Coccidioides posadasii RMSCC 3488 TaxID=454284 RepID=A0A0J6F292_COCPO|nr:hypothetical protein CPAG_03352 [Coccidioides posadasii RMSCC 3488]